MDSEEQFDAYKAAYDNIQTAVAGVDVTIAVKALLDSISLLIAVGARDQPMAFSMIDTLPQLMKVAVINEWDRAREMRARGMIHTPPTGGVH